MIVRKKNEKRLFDKTYEFLLKKILAGDLAPGSPVSELALTRELGVSRTPIHEAIRQLEKDGLIFQAANCRPVVVGLTKRDIVEISQMRILLEGEAVSLAARKDHSKMIADLRKQIASLKRQKNRTGWIKAWVKHDEDFHRKIARASGNKRLAQDIGRYRLLHRVFNNMAFGKSGAPLEMLKQATGEHEEILNALEKSQPEPSRKAMQGHIGKWKDFFAESLGRKVLPKKPNSIRVRS